MYLYLVPTLKTSGAMRLLLHTPSWRAERQLYYNFPVQQQDIIIITIEAEEATDC
jgi:hypothetical protein